MIRLSAVIAALLASWLLFDWLDVGAPAIADLEVLQLEMADLPEPTAQAVAGATFEQRTILTCGDDNQAHPRLTAYAAAFARNSGARPLPIRSTKLSA